MPDSVKNVPAAKVGKVVQGFVDGGAVHVKAVRQADGKWTVIVVE